MFLKLPVCEVFYSKLIEFMRILLERIDEFRRLNYDRSLCRCLMSRYVPPTANFLSADAQTFADFQSKILSKWENISVQKIIENSSGETIRLLKEDMEYLKSMEDSIIYKSIWNDTFNDIMHDITNPTCNCIKVMFFFVLH